MKIKSKSKAMLLKLEASDWQTLDELAQAAKSAALFKKRGHIPDTIRVFLELYRRSKLSPDEFIQHEYILMRVNP